MALIFHYFQCTVTDINDKKDVSTRFYGQTFGESANIICDRLPENDTEPDKNNENATFEEIDDNVYTSPRPKKKIEENDCDCKSVCLNRLTAVECGTKCPVRDRCTNRCFQNHEYAPCETFETDKKGFGLKATSDIPNGTFIGQYVGDVINKDELEKREQEYSKSEKKECYVMALENGFFIDATKKGNKFRFINHSCDPNAEAQKWNVSGETRIGFLSIKPIKSGDEITFNYNFQLNG